MFHDTELYPTPRWVARKMLAKISKDAKHFLDPSAGKGDLADFIRDPVDATTDEEYEEYCEKFGRGRDNYRKVEVDCIEVHPDLISVLRGKEHTVVGYDWLDYAGTSYYDAVLLNPPFSEGARHLLKAWDFLHSGEIVCLLNEETIQNAYTEERQRLAKIIAEHGNVEYLGDCFSSSERKTDVRVAMVYLQKRAQDDTIDLWASEVTAENLPSMETEGDPNMIAIRDNLGNMQRWYDMANEHMLKGFEHIRKGMLYMQQNHVSAHGGESDGYGGDRRQADLSTIVGMALSNTISARAEFLRLHRRNAWSAVFDKMEFRRWLDSKQTDQFLRDVARDSTIPFTAANIKSTLENVFLQRRKLFEQSVANVFDELTSHHAGNTNVKSEGWKTNDSYKVNQKLIFPYGCRYSYNSFDLYSGNAETIYNDLDRILCVLDARNFSECFTVGRALRNSFQRLGYNVPGGFYNQADSQYFEIRFFKKGTVHLKWKRKDLLEAFSIKAAAGKKWIGENTQEQAA